AILDPVNGTISVYLNNGKGTFTLDANVDGHGSSVLLAGYQPRGLTLGDVNNDNKIDLLVGNLYGDILILLGNGDGTFQQLGPVDQDISMAVLDPGTANEGVVLGNPKQDKVSLQNPAGTTNTVLLQHLKDLLGPGVQQADLNRDGYTDLVVV